MRQTFDVYTIYMYICMPVFVVECIWLFTWEIELYAKYVTKNKFHAYCKHTYVHKCICKHTYKHVHKYKYICAYIYIFLFYRMWYTSVSIDIIKYKAFQKPDSDWALSAKAACTDDPAATHSRIHLNAFLVSCYRLFTLLRLNEYAQYICTYMCNYFLYFALEVVFLKSAKRVHQRFA